MDGGAHTGGPDRSTGERWVQVRALLESALERDATSRVEFLKEACGADTELFSETQTLLRALDSAPPSPDQPISGLTPSRDPMVGASVGPWKLLRHVGTGGFASVYAAARNDQEFRK